MAAVSTCRYPQPRIALPFILRGNQFTEVRLNGDITGQTINIKAAGT